jgi:hypothetical protein
MIKNLVVVTSGGALALGLAGVVSPAMAWGSVGAVTQASRPMPDGTPIIRDSIARFGCDSRGPLNLLTPSDPPVIRDSAAQAATPTIRDARAQPAGPACLMLPGDPPIIRHVTTQLGDPDDGGQLTATTAQLGDPDDGGQLTAMTAQFGDPDDGGQ